MTTTAYADKDQWAVNQEFADWDAYAAANPNSPPLATITRLLNKATRIINRNIGSGATTITDERYIDDLEDLCIEMVNRMRQINIAEGRAQSIPMFSPNDYLVEREREQLRQIGRVLGYRLGGKVVF